MALTIIQTGSSLQLMDEAGGLTTLTLPSGITLQTNVPPRWCVHNKNVVLVNTPSQPLAITSDGVVRILSPKPPRIAPILAGVNGGTLSGSFTVKETFVTLDTFGNILSESGYSPLSTKVAIASKFLGVSNADISPDAITLRRFYRTTDNGAVFFQWVDLDGNVITTIQDDLSDAGLSIFSAPVLGTPPRLTLIAEFRGRLFGVGDTDIDNVVYTEAGIQYAWPTKNIIPIVGAGSDEFGIVGLAARREALLVGRRNILSQITGTGKESGVDTDLDPIVLSQELGFESQETVKVFRDTAYFLWKDGIYSVGSDGITCLSDGSGDGKGNVRSWFTGDSYFNRDKFNIAFAHIDPYQNTYRLFLAGAGSDVVDHWVEYQMDDKTWFGPHKTDLFAPTSAFIRTTAADITVPVIGALASVFQEQALRTDGTVTPIAFDAIGPRHDMEVPDDEKYFGELSLLTKPLTSGVMQVKSRTGNQNATRTIVQNYDLRLTRKRMGRLGKGKHSQIELVNANVGEDVQVLGYEVDPVHILGRR
jgi:hypothetical protein